MLTSKEMAAKVQELMNQGMSLDEALVKVMEENKPPRITDRVAWIKSLNNLEELRRAIKSARGKKSKGKNNEQSLQKATAEIKAGQERLNEILAKINEAEDPVRAAIEWGDSPDGVIQRWLERMEAEIDGQVLLKKADLNLTNQQLKDLLLDIDYTPPRSIQRELEKLGKDYVKTYKKRVDACDQRIWAINRKVRFIEGSK